MSHHPLHHAYSGSIFQCDRPGSGAHDDTLYKLTLHTLHVWHLSRHSGGGMHDIPLLKSAKKTLFLHADQYSLALLNLTDWT